MKLFIHMLFFLGTASICLANTQPTKKGSKPNQNASKSNSDHLSVFIDNSPAAKRQEDEAGGQSVVRSDTKNSVPPVKKSTDPPEDKHVLGMQEKIQENYETMKLSLGTKTQTGHVDVLKGEELEDISSTTILNKDILNSPAIKRQKDQASEQSETKESKNTVTPVNKNTNSTEDKPNLELLEGIQNELSSIDRRTEASNVILKCVGSEDRNPIISANDTSSLPTVERQRAQDGDQAEEASECEVNQTSEFLKVPEKSQATLPSETNKSGSTEGIKQEEGFTPTLNMTEFNQEQITPTPAFCPRIWPECLSDQFDHTMSEVSNALMTFTLRLFQKLSSMMDSKPNLVVAPISVALALSNLMLGSGGETRNNMLSKLYKEISDIGCIHEALKNLTTHDSVISASNFFYKKDLHINDAFIDQSYRFYGAKGLHLDNDNEKNLNKINSWVSEKTKTLIPTLLQRLPSDLQMILLNVIYYQGKWLSKFDPKHTKEMAFHRPSLTSVKVPMMQGHKYPLQHTHDSYLQAQVARFPLSDNCSLLILLPQSHGKDALKKMTEKLNQKVVNTVMTQLEERPMRATVVSLPQLKLDTNLLLNDALRKLGFADLFEYPNLCGLSSDTELAVSDIHHRAVLEVKEEGVKAAAATTITVVARTVSMFSVQKPFLFILVSDESKVPILIGRVSDPSE